MRTRDPHLSARTRLGSLSLAALLWLGCPPAQPGNFDGGYSGDPPQIALAIPDSNAVGSALALSISVSGCDSVKTLALYDRGQFIKTIVYTGAPTLVSLKPNEVPYNHRMAADLALVAKAWCNDGRSNTSSPQAAAFFPVDTVVKATTSGQVVPDNFYAEGSGAGTFFIGCSQDGAGRRLLVKVDTTGAVRTTNSTLPFPCSSATVFTDRNPSTGTRWMWEPGVGAMAYDSDLNMTAFTSTSVKALGVGPDGDAIFWEDVPLNSAIDRVPAKGTSTQSAGPLWTHPTRGYVLGTPLVNPDGAAYIAYIESTIVGGGSATVSVERLDYRTGATAGYYQLKSISYGFGDAPPSPAVAFNPSGTVLYVANQLSNGQSEVLACSTAGAGCTGPTLKWRSPTLIGNVELVLPYAAGSRVAVVTPQHVYFLRADTGLVSGGGAVDPDGALVANGVQQGAGRDFYILFGPNKAGAQPLEVVGLDSAETGEVFRYELLGGSLTVAVADDGQPWLRIGTNLVKPLPLQEYRLVK